LSAHELARFDAVVFDPPRAGARTQSEALGESVIKNAVAVSCNPATFARDAQILCARGMTLNWVQPIDQFVWSARVELVARFTR
jgi:23S rRNA (uracil1939-C5)-methyltransferase